MKRCIANPRSPKLRDSKAASAPEESTTTEISYRFHTAWTQSRPLTSSTSSPMMPGDPGLASASIDRRHRPALGPVHPAKKAFGEGDGPAKILIRTCGHYSGTKVTAHYAAA